MDTRSAVDPIAGEDEIDFRQYLKVLWRRRLVVIAVTLAATLAAGLFSFLTPPVYEAQAMLLIVRPSLQFETLTDPRNPNLKVIVLPQQSQTLPAQPIVELARSPLLQRKLTGEVLGNAISGAKLDESLIAVGNRESGVVKLTVRGEDPDRVAKVANLWGEVVVSESESLFSPGRSKVRPVKLIEAVVPDTPVAPRRDLNVTLGAILGVMAGLVLAFVMEYLSIANPAPVPSPVASEPARPKELEG